MSINLLDGGTTSTAGGAAQTFDRTSKPVTNGYEYTDVSETDFYARQSVVIKVKQPTLQSDGTYSKMRVTIQFVLPLTLADGSLSYGVGRAEIEYHPEASAANVAELREMAAQCCIAAGFDSVYDAGTLPS
jgi:hypothetical protein